MEGTIKFFKPENGYGFITAEDGNDYFVHKSAVADGVSLNEGDKVTFEIEQNDRGPKAVNVVKVTDEA